MAVEVLCEPEEIVHQLEKYSDDDADYFADDFWKVIDLATTPNLSSRGGRHYMVARRRLEENEDIARRYLIRDTRLWAGYLTILRQVDGLMPTGQQG